MKMLIAAIATLTVIGVAQTPSPIRKPTITVTPLPSESVPTGSCKLLLPNGEEGYLQDSDGHNHFTPANAKDVSDYLQAALHRGLVVTIYPQPNGRIFVIATCGMPTKLIPAS